MNKNLKKCNTRHYESIRKDLSVSQLKQKISKRIKNVDDFHLLDRIHQVLSHKDDKGKIEEALTYTTKNSNFGNTDIIVSEMMSSIAELQGTTNEKRRFVESLEDGQALDVKSLQMPQSSFDTIFTSSFAEKFFISNANFGRGQQGKGPGEFALAIIAPEISLAKKGDIVINKQTVEVKAAGKTGKAGRLGEPVSAAKEQIVETLRKSVEQHLKTPAKKKYFKAEFESVISKSLTRSIQALHVLLDENSKAVSDAVSTTLSLTFPARMSRAIGNAAGRDPTGSLAEVEYMKQNFNWYKQKDKFDSLMAIWFTGRKVYNFKTGEEFAAMRLSGKLGAAGISFIPSKSNEVYVQVTFTKK